MLSQHGMAPPPLGFSGDSFRVWREAVDVFNKQS
jgi:hypothetical protein